MITGTHAILYTTDADATRAFLRDVLAGHMSVARVGVPQLRIAVSG